MDADVDPVLWYVYVLVSVDESRTYVGVTTDLERRLVQHNGELPGGAKSTRGGRPWTIGAHFGPYEDRGLALRIELRLKKRSGRARLSVSVDELVAEAG